MKKSWGMPRASCSFSETQFLPNFLTWPASFSPSLHPISILFCSTRSSPNPHCSMFVPSLAPFFYPPHCHHNASMFHPLTQNPAVDFQYLPGEIHSLWQSLQGIFGSELSLHPVCHHRSFAQTLLIARLAVPEHTRFSFLPLCLHTWPSFGLILDL